MSAALASRSRYIPWIFVAGFAIVIAVNGVMMTLAISSFSGLYTPTPRDRGLHYNAIVAEKQSRDALGWQVETAWRPETNRLELRLVDGSAKALAGAQVRAELIRPVEKRPPLAVALGDLGEGRFAGYVALPERGNWDLDVYAERGNERFAITRRLFLK
jgi:nitrogen fixation protein FixH